MNILGIETSCDESAAAVVRDGRDVLSSVVFSQVPLHKPYGGVVPEIASRSHVEALPGVIEQAVAGARINWNALDGVAVTYGPGLATALLVGLSAAKGLALRLDRPLIGVNHLEAHLYSIFLGDGAPRPEEICPFMALLVSGGHTCLVRVRNLGDYEVVGQTTDDAAGEAFDKGANLLRLGYPGGPVIDKTANNGNPEAVRFPRGVQRNKFWTTADFNPDLCFTFSGLKTALLYHLRNHPPSSEAEVSDLAASYQEAIVDSLLDRTRQAVCDERVLAIVGGVSLNRRLREKAKQMTRELGIRLIFAAREYCADNAAMVAGPAGAGLGVRGEPAMRLDASPSLGLDMPL